MDSSFLREKYILYCGRLRKRGLSFFLKKPVLAHGAYRNDEIITNHRKNERIIYYLKQSNSQN